jgi:hypothetical protein
MACWTSACGFQRGLMVSYILPTQNADDKTETPRLSVAIRKFHARMTLPCVHSSEVKVDEKGNSVAKHTRLVHSSTLSTHSWYGAFDCIVIRLYYNAVPTTDATKKLIRIGTCNVTLKAC